MRTVAIDGPAGAGKSTVARAAAAQLGFIYVDTGALYRAIGLYALQSGIRTDDEAAVSSLLERISIDLAFRDGTQRVLINGEDVSEQIRTPEVSMAASSVSALPVVRQFLLDLQRGMAKKHDVVMDGRDIGTVVLPHAQVKIFLTASVDERAMRRTRELLEKNKQVDFETVRAELIQRDYNDSHRAIAPLKAAPDAVLVDTTGLTLEASVAQVVETIKEKLK